MSLRTRNSGLGSGKWQKEKTVAHLPPYTHSFLIHTPSIPISTPGYVNELIDCFAGGRLLIDFYIEQSLASLTISLFIFVTLKCLWSPIFFLWTKKTKYMEKVTLQLFLNSE